MQEAPHLTQFWSAKACAEEYNSTCRAEPTACVTLLFLSVNCSIMIVGRSGAQKNTTKIYARSRFCVTVGTRATVVMGGTSTLATGFRPVVRVASSLIKTKRMSSTVLPRRLLKLTQRYGTLMRNSFDRKRTTRVIVCCALFMLRVPFFVGAA